MRLPSISRPRGFTLIEAALTTVIIGVGMLSMMRLFGACTTVNHNGAATTTAVLLASHIQETMAGLSFNDPITGRNTFGHESGETVATYNDIDDFDGLTFNPPIDAMRKPIADLSQYSQVVSVVPVYSTQLSGNSGQTLDIPKTTYTGAARVTVRILYQRTPKLPAEEVYRLSWIRVDD